MKLTYRQKRRGLGVFDSFLQSAFALLKNLRLDDLLFFIFSFFWTEEKIRNYPHVLAETLKMQALFADSVACRDFLCASSTIDLWEFPLIAMAMETKLGAENFWVPSIFVGKPGGS